MPYFSCRGDFSLEVGNDPERFFPDLGIPGGLTKGFWRSQYSNIQLSDADLGLIQILGSNPWYMISYRKLIRAADLPDETTERNIQDRLAKIQKMLKTAGKKPLPIESTKGWGYCYKGAERVPTAKIQISDTTYLDLRNGHIVDNDTYTRLSGAEFKVAYAYLSQPNTILSYEDVINHTGLPEDTSYEQIANYIKKINQKAKSTGYQGRLINNVIGSGRYANIDTDISPVKNKKLFISRKAYLDVNARKLVNGEQEVFLTATLFNLAKALLENPSQVIAYDDLITLGGFGENATSSNVINNIFILNKRLRSIGINDDVFVCANGWGFYSKTHRQIQPKKNLQLKIDDNAFLDVRNGQIQNGEKTTQLQNGNFALLSFLLNRSDSVVVKEALVDELGISEDNFDTEISLAKRRLRAQLNAAEIDSAAIDTIMDFEYASVKIPLCLEGDEVIAHICPYSSRIVNGDKCCKILPAELELFSALAKKPHRIFSRDELMEDIDMHEDIFDGAIDSRVKRCRRALRIVGLDANIITTVTGVGFYANTSLRIEPSPEERICIDGAAYIDLRCLSVHNKGSTWQLSAIDFSVLCKMLGRRGQVFSNEHFFSKISQNDNITPEAFRTSIKRIRAVFREANINELIIRNVRGIGYQGVHYDA